MNLTDIQEMYVKVKENVQKVIVGKEETIEQLMISMLASGHVLLEDVPGTGKTLLAKSMAKSLGCKFKRVQFTPDLMPTDLSGTHFFNQKESEFQFREGPLFTNILLADELNRATPRTQSSLLECMEERQLTIDGDTHILERPFFVIATQNPVENQGTFPLPEAQLDRFLMKIQVGYPSKQESVDILKRFRKQQPLESIEAVADQAAIVEAQEIYHEVRMDDAIIEYVVEIVEQTRKHPGIEMGVSPRGAQALMKAVQIRAVLQGREYVLPDDVKALVQPVLAHRLICADSFGSEADNAAKILEDILQKAPVPTEQKLQATQG